MKCMSLLLVVMLALTSLVRAQDASPQAAPPATGHDQMHGEHHRNMMKMHQEMEGMKADLEKMKSDLAQMKANVTKIGDPAEKGRWQNNVDMWELMVGHMEKMLHHMEAMGPGGMGHGMMHDHGMGGTAPAPPAEKKPE